MLFKSTIQHEDLRTKIRGFAEEKKQKYLVPLAKGEKLGEFGLTDRKIDA